MNFFRKLWLELTLFFPKEVPAWMLPSNVRTELLDREDVQSGLDLYQLLKPLMFFVNGIVCGLPNGEFLDFGSIPRFLHWLAWPTELELRVVYGGHDGSYTLWGGLRRYKSDATLSGALNACPQSRLRIDYELMRNIIVAKMTGRWNPFRGLFTTPLPWRDAWKIVPYRILVALYRTWLILWHPLRALIIFLVVRAAGWHAWNTIEPETEPVS